MQRRNHVVVDNITHDHSADIAEHQNWVEFVWYTYDGSGLSTATRDFGTVVGFGAQVFSPNTESRVCLQAPKCATLNSIIERPKPETLSLKL